MLSHRRFLFLSSHMRLISDHMCSTSLVLALIAPVQMLTTEQNANSTDKWSYGTLMSISYCSFRFIFLFFLWSIYIDGSIAIP